MVSNPFPERAFPKRCAPSPGKNILSSDAYKLTRELWGTSVPNVHEVLLQAVALPTSFALAARHGDGVVEEAAAEGMVLQQWLGKVLQQSSLLNTVLPYALGHSDIDVGRVARLRASILAGGGSTRARPMLSNGRSCRRTRRTSRLQNRTSKGLGFSGSRICGIGQQASRSMCTGDSRCMGAAWMP